MTTVPPDPGRLAEVVREALREDLGTGDVTTDSVISAQARARAVVVAREEGVLCGVPVAREVFRQADPAIGFEELRPEGEPFAAGDRLLAAEGPARGILSAERTVLNFLGRLCGVATAASRYVARLSAHRATLLDTRKTTPLLRFLEKYAVRVGGGRNHRMGLYDMVLIKDNHIAAAGSIRAAVESARRGAAGVRLEVEVENERGAREAAEAGADVIMLDNMSPDEVAACLKTVDGRAETEVSGGVTLENVEAYARLGVDYVSVGAITHSARALDLSLELEVRQ